MAAGKRKFGDILCADAVINEVKPGMIWISVGPTRFWKTIQEVQ
jgi:hypothetical protein